MEHVANHVEEDPRAEADNAATLLLLMEDEAVLVYRQSQSLVIYNHVQVTFDLKVSKAL